MYFYNKNTKKKKINISHTLPIFSSNNTSSLFNSQRSLGIGCRSIAPERLVTGNALWN